MDRVLPADLVQRISSETRCISKFPGIAAAIGKAAAKMRKAVLTFENHRLQTQDVKLCGVTLSLSMAAGLKSPALHRPRQGDVEFEAPVGYTQQDCRLTNNKL